MRRNELMFEWKSFHQMRFERNCDDLIRFHWHFLLFIWSGSSIGQKWHRFFRYRRTNKEKEEEKKYFFKTFEGDVLVSLIFIMFVLKWPSTREKKPFTCSYLPSYSSSSNWTCHRMIIHYLLSFKYVDLKRRWKRIKDRRSKGEQTEQNRTENESNRVFLHKNRIFVTKHLYS